jgi:hypothetical protein
MPVATHTLKTKQNRPASLNSASFSKAFSWSVAPEFFWLSLIGRCGTNGKHPLNAFQEKEQKQILNQ